MIDLSKPADYLVSVLLVVVAVIHLLPVTGVRGGDQLTRLYGRAFDDPNLQILMRHRAVLFGLVGVLLLYAAIRPAHQAMALTAGFVSVVSFLWLVRSVGGHNAQLARVFRADVVALACLVVAAIVRGCSG